MWSQKWVKWKIILDRKSFGGVVLMDLCEVIDTINYE